jgi:hypothetical protein
MIFVENILRRKTFYVETNLAIDNNINKSKLLKSGNHYTSIRGA